MTIGLFQIVVLALIAVLLFGRGPISAALGELGASVRSFRRGLREDELPAPLAVESPDTHSPADK